MQKKYNQKYIHEIEKELESKHLDVENIKYTWRTIKEAIITDAKKLKKWHNDKGQ